jgi:hypothetical protein
MKSGCKPTKLSHKDFSYHKNRTKLYGATSIPQFPTFYNADRINWRPEQDIAETEPIAHTAQPLGCTNFSTAYCANNLLGELKYSPDIIENGTHANANGGADVRSQLDWAVENGLFPAYYNVRKQNGLDSFDAISLALVEGALEHRVVTVGTPWYAEFEAVDASGVLKMPNLNNIMSWHNSDFLGRITINGVPYLMNESHQGIGYGDKGLCYWSRELTNSVFAINGSVAYIPAHAVEDPATITLDWWNKVLSMIRQFGKSWLPFSYGGTMLWDTPAHIRRNIRVMCDNAGLSTGMKNIICACIKVESNWNPRAVGTKNRNGSQDFGLVQMNNALWIGEGNVFTSIEDAFNPQKSAQFMIDQAKKGHIRWWMSYTTGAYKKYLVSESLPSIPY